MLSSMHDRYESQDGHHEIVYETFKEYMQHLRIQSPTTSSIQNP